MTPERWDRVKALFHSALEVAEMDRGTFLEQHCGTDQELRREVAALLGQHPQEVPAPSSADGSSGEVCGRYQMASLLAVDEKVGDSIRRPPADSILTAPRRAATGATDEETVSFSPVESPPPKAQPKLHSFGDYELLGEIDHGGMGVVYKARQISLNRLVALKMILAGQFASQTEVRRFQAEARAAATLDHHHIVGIYEIGQHEGQYYFTMPYIDGQSLDHLEARGRRCASPEAAKLLVKVARAVQYAHERGILHRDLKPSNILIDAHGEPHILDFGLACHLGGDTGLTMEGAVLGTPSFMPPEQAAGKIADLGARSDIYSLGAILYFLLTGRPPFKAASAMDTLVQVLEGEVIVPRLINPRVERDLERICLRCLERSPERRYPNAASLAQDLERFVRHEAINARAPGFRSLVLHWMRHQLALVLRLFGLAICLGIAQVKFQFYPDVSRGQHLGIMSTLGMWGLFSIACQWAGKQQRWSRILPYLWVTLDTVCLTVILQLDEAVPSDPGQAFIPDNAIPGPLLGCFPVLVALSGLWFRVPLVGFATLMSILAYSVLIVDLRMKYGVEYPVWYPNWHVIFLLFLVVTGCAVAYQVHRVRALSRFYDRRL